MSKRTMIIAQKLSPELLEQIKKTASDWNIVSGKNPEDWQGVLKEAEIIAGWRRDMAETCLVSGTRLRWIQSWSAGVDSYPLNQLKSLNIQLTAANGVHTYPISETIFALMLALTRKIHTYVRNQSQKVWHHGHLNLELHEKTIGIIGVGAIGKETAKIAKAFGMTVIGVRNSGQREDHVDQMITSEDLDKILPMCDYVVNTLPLTSKTRRLFGEKQFQHMKSTSFFINIGRGETVDEKALISALQNGSIGGAGLDVFETEPLEKTSPLWELENVIVTPHTAGSNEHYNGRVVQDILLPNLKKYLKGDPLSLNLVNYDEEY